MDVERFIPCLIKTANNYVTKAREHFESNKSVFEKMNFLPENSAQMVNVIIYMASMNNG